jgi:hypothetical protein
MPNRSSIKGRGCITAREEPTYIARLEVKATSGWLLSSREAAEEKQPEATAPFSMPLPPPVELRRSDTIGHPDSRSRQPYALLYAWHRMGPRWLSRQPSGGSSHCGLCSGGTVGRHEKLLEYPAALSRSWVGDLDPAVLSADDP